MRDDQTVAEMVNEVLLRQAKARADRNGEPIEAAMSAVVGTEAGRQLVDLRDGPHGDEGVEEWQVGIEPSQGEVPRITLLRGWVNNIACSRFVTYSPSLYTP
jgi:hypothetical protein